MPHFSIETQMLKFSSVFLPPTSVPTVEGYTYSPSTVSPSFTPTTSHPTVKPSLPTFRPTFYPLFKAPSSGPTATATNSKQLLLVLLQLISKQLIVNN